MLITLDNFVIGESLNLQNIPSWAGNVFLIVGAIWAGKDKSKEAAPFGFWVITDLLLPTYASLMFT